MIIRDEYDNIIDHNIMEATEWQLAKEYFVRK